MLEAPEPIFYTEDDLERIIEASGGLPDALIQPGLLCVSGDQLTWHIDDDAALVDRRKELKSQLEFMASQFRFNEKVDNFARSWHDGHEHYTKVYSQCRRLRQYITESIKYVPCGGERPRPNLAALNALLEQTEYWCLQSAGTDPRGRKAPRLAHHSQIISLGWIYSRIFEDNLTFSVRDGATTGPFVQFMTACLTPIMGSNTPKPEALRKRWARATTKNFKDHPSARVRQRAATCGADDAP